ncbi:MAG: hypothetical protein JRZ94_04540, partial [Nitrososphaerota archaeon]|nr:hypothetical protein [Nitrososphaerota archaeon]
FAANAAGVCSYHGTCVQPNTCACSDPYSGNTCQTATTTTAISLTLVGATVGILALTAVMLAQLSSFMAAGTGAAAAATPGLGFTGGGYTPIAQGEWI